MKMIGISSFLPFFVDGAAFLATVVDFVLEAGVTFFGLDLAAVVVVAFLGADLARASFSACFFWAVVCFFVVVGVATVDLALVGVVVLVGVVLVGVVLVGVVLVGVGVGLVVVGVVAFKSLALKGFDGLGFAVATALLTLAVSPLLGSYFTTLASFPLTLFVCNIATGSSAGLGKFAGAAFVFATANVLKEGPMNGMSLPT